MNKKLIFSILVIIALLFSFSGVFATDGMQSATNAVSNSVNKTEGTLGNGAKDAANAVSNVTNGATNAVKDAVNGVTGGTKNAVDHMGNNDRNNNNHDNATATTNNHGNYTAKRTAANATTFMGMNATTWTWVILGIAAIAIVALVWYYSMQFTERNYNDNE